MTFPINFPRTIISFSSCLNWSNKGNVIPTPAKLLWKCADAPRQRSHGLKIPLFLTENLQQKKSICVFPSNTPNSCNKPNRYSQPECWRSSGPAQLAAATAPCKSSGLQMRDPWKGEGTCQRTWHVSGRALTSLGPLTPGKGILHEIIYSGVLSS